MANHDKRLTDLEKAQAPSWPMITVMAPAEGMAEAVAAELAKIGYTGDPAEYPGVLVRYTIPISPELWKGI